MRIDRTLNYFELESETLNTTELGTVMLQFFRKIGDRNLTSDPIDSIKKGFGYIYLTNISIDERQKLIRGIMTYNVTDVLPVKGDMLTGKSTIIEAEEHQGIAELSHFILSYSGEIILSLEHNRNGGKLNDMLNFVNVHLLKLMESEAKIGAIAFVLDTIDTFVARINKCSSFVARVHKSNLNRLDQFSNQLESAFKSAYEMSDAEYVELTLKMDYQNLNHTGKVTKLTHGIAQKLANNKSLRNIFGKLRVKAQDEENNNRLSIFDFLIEKYYDEIKVETQERSRHIITFDFFEEQENKLLTLLHRR